MVQTCCGSSRVYFDYFRDSETPKPVATTMLNPPSGTLVYKSHLDKGGSRLRTVASRAHAAYFLGGHLIPAFRLA